MHNRSELLTYVTGSLIVSCFIKRRDINRAKTSAKTRLACVLYAVQASGVRWNVCSNKKRKKSTFLDFEKS